MNSLMIEVGGKKVSCRLTMGAMLLFKRETGKDVDQLDGSADMELLLQFMYCCVKCSCKAEGIDFDVDFETFCCTITPQDVAQWSQSVNGGETKKKETAEP